MIDIAAMQASPQWQALSADQQATALAEARRTNARAMTQPAIPAPLEQRARAIGADPQLVRGIVATEGSGDRDVSPKGAIGRFQIMPATAARYGVSPPQLRNPQVNEITGLRLIRDLGEKYREKGHQNWRDLAAAAYFSGEGNITPQGTIRHPQRSDGNVTVVQYVQRAKEHGGWGTVPTGGRMAEPAGRIDIEAMQQSEGFRALSPEQQQQAMTEAQRRNAQIVGLHPEAPPLGEPLKQPTPFMQQTQRAIGMTERPLVPRRVAMPLAPGEEAPLPGILPMAGQLLGGGAAAAAVPVTSGFSALAIPAAATAGDVLGYTLESVLMRGRFPKWQELAVEGAWSVVPEVVESGVRAGGRALMRGPIGASQAGRMLRNAEQYRQGAAAATGVFNAPTKEAVDAAFAQLRALGRQVDTDGLLDALKTKYSPADRMRLRADIGKMDAEVNARLGRVGDKRFQMMYEQVMQATKPPPPPQRQAGFLSTLEPGAPPQPSLPKMDLGDAQDLRSAARVQSEKYAQGTPRNELLQQFKMDVDDMILTKLNAQGYGEDAQALLDARKAYQRFAAAEDLGELLLKHSKPTVVKGNELWRLNLNAVVEDLTKNTSAQAKNLNRHLDSIPDARAAWEQVVNQLSQYNRYIEVSGLGGEGIRNVPFASTTIRTISELLLSHEGSRELLTHAMRHGGQVTPNILAPMVNLVRRGPYPTEVQANKLPQTSNAELLEQIKQFLMQGNVPTAE